MTIIKTAEIPYLNEDVIEKYKNVIIISTEGMMIKMNSLILCAMSHPLKMALLEFDDFDSDPTIITEFSLEELKQVKDYCTKGSCDAMTAEIMNSFGLLTPLSVSENNINFKLEPTEIPMKHEIIEIKEEPMDYLDVEYGFDYASDDNSFHHSIFNEKPVRKIKQKRKKPITEKDSNDLGRPGKTPKKYNEFSENELELFKTFELPKPLEEYVSKPKNLADLQSKIEYSKLDQRKRFQCSQCELRSRSVQFLKAHEIKFHNPNEHLPCPYCIHTFYIEDVESFKMHMFKHFVLSKNIQKLNR